MASEAQDLIPNSPVGSLSRQGMTGVAARAMVLVAGIALVAVPVTLVAYALREMEGVQVALAAMVLCLLAGLLALLAAEAARRFGHPLSGTLLAMGVRTTLPMIVLLVSYSRGSLSANTDFAFYTVVFYLAVLALETFMEVNVLKASQSCSGA